MGKVGVRGVGTDSLLVDLCKLSGRGFGNASADVNGEDPAEGREHTL